MDTPEKDQPSNPLSKFEDSPVFSYINSLSPIKPVKTINSGQIFTPLSFSSPPSVFDSPHISSYKEKRFLRRHQFSDSPTPEVRQSGDKDSITEGVLDGPQVSKLRTEQVGCLGCEKSSEQQISESGCEELTLLIELPKNLKYDAVKTDAASETGYSSASEVQFVQRFSSEGLNPYERDIDLHGTCEAVQRSETTESNWEHIISNTADLLSLEEPVVQEYSEESNQVALDSCELSCSSTLVELPKDGTSDLQVTKSVGQIGSCGQQKSEEPSSQTEVEEQKDRNQTPAVLSSSIHNKLVVSDSHTHIKDTEQMFTQPCSKLQNIRRPLVFEKAGAHKKQSFDDPNCSSPGSLKSECKVTSNSRSLPGIGLHLNALTTTVKDDGIVLKHENIAFGRKDMCVQGSVSSINSLASDQRLLDKSLTLQSGEKDLLSHENKIQDVDDASKASTLEIGTEFSHSSPKRKRLERDSSEGCKRCNCKKSKCLKLYCDCFAAGLYCIEPCSCQDCFNKPVHEGKVLETRRQIESRNPLAFAPKVIRKSDSITEFQDQINKTPASARHKRGCNCKKSSCLKKYCECFQGGVGCSINCRCEGCKNTFGWKNGVEEAETQGEKTADCEKNSNVSLQNDMIQTSEEGRLNHGISVMPSKLRRPSVKLPFKGKPSKSSSLVIGSSTKLPTDQKIGTSDFLSQMPKFEEHLGRITGDETLDLLNSSPSSSVKTSSPTCKRISPPHQRVQPSPWRGRKLILRSIPSFPSLTMIQESSDTTTKLQ